MICPLRRPTEVLARRVRRRGVLMLVVLSMLTLFLMLGAAYIVTATRAREAARAYARLTYGGDEARVPHARLLDMVLMKVLAGGTAAVAPIGYPPALLRFESLLADKYGTTTDSGTATSVSVAGPVLTATVNFSSSHRPTELNGRVLTFVEPGRPVTSHRIIRASGGAGTNTPVAVLTLQLDVPVSGDPFVLPAAPTRVLVNGREFAGEPPFNEGWDGYDFANNPFLAQVRTSATSIAASDVLAGSYVDTVVGNGRFVIPSGGYTADGATYSFASGTYAFSTAAGGTLLTTGVDLNGDQIPDVADNDNDGVADGLFLDFGIPSVVDGSGNTVQLRASVLVLPLDGRFNVNAHGSLSPILYSSAHSNWSSAPAVTGTSGISRLAEVPLGSGYGPAEVQANLGSRDEPKTLPAVLSSGSSPPRLFDSGMLKGLENPRWSITVGSRAGDARQSGVRPVGSRYSANEVTPRVGNLEAKYGEQPATSTAAPSLSIQLDDAAFPFARPGQPDVDDEASRINDRRALPNAAAQTNFGITGTWWTGSSSFNWGPTASASAPPPRGIYNSPPDLHGRMKMLTLTDTTAPPGTTRIAPSLAYAQPEWSDATSARETKDDPYEFRLDTRRGFGGLLFDPTTGGTGTSASSTQRDNPFTAAELECVLRPYDIDTNRLPPRLAALLGSAAEEARLTITTDSWDTTAITGTAALAIFGTSGWLQRPSLSGAVIYGSTPLAGVIGGEVSRGERFDLNRALGPVGSANADLQRQCYFKDLYTLAVMLSSTGGPVTVMSGTTVLSGTAATAVLAQWAANVVEFRDADSQVLPFEYDVDPSNGWNVDGNVSSVDGGGDRAVVWGAERPEILIAETLAWENLDSGTSGGLFVALHRPWHAKAYGAGASSIIDAEPCDVAFDTLSGGMTGRPTNVVDVGKKAHSGVSGAFNNRYNSGDPAEYPIWRLRIVSTSTTGTATEYVRFDTDTNQDDYGVVGVASGSSAGNGNAKPKIAADSTLSLRGDDAIVITTATGPAAITMTVSGSGCRISGSSGPLRVPRAVGTAPGASRTAVVHLERLADPTEPASLAVWNADPLLNLATATNSQRYLVVDSSTLTVFNTGTSPGGPAPTLQAFGRVGAVAATGSGTTNPVSGTGAAAGASTADTVFWRSTTSPGMSIPLVPGASGSFPNLASGSNAVPGISWLPWPNRPLTSAAELLLVPRHGPSALLREYMRPRVGNQAIVGIPVPLDLLFDAVHVPTRFAGIHASSANTSPAATGLDTNVFTVNHFSSFREPGRVNLNVVPSDEVWNAVVAGPLNGPVVTATAAGLALTGTADWSPAPATSMLHLLALSATTTTIVSDTTTTAFSPTTAQGGGYKGAVSGSSVAMPTDVLAWDKNPMHEIYTATRLANTVTSRSNVFGVWITLRESIPNDPDSVTIHRAFYIVDRSIPVGFETNQVNNAWDCVRVRRIIE